MSKTIIIQKNGIAQTMTVDKLRLPKYGGGTEDWLPKDETNLVSIEVKQNGTYKASDFSAYGISSVKVKCLLNGGTATSAEVEKTVNAMHNPCPAEGGVARNMSAHHLETALSESGTCQWVPESEVSLGTKYINVDNQTYNAEDDGKYGYDEVIVSGISITKDGDTITHTDGSGTMTYTLPDHIEIYQLPRYTVYFDGEEIDYTGMIVKAYNENGTVWTSQLYPDGVIPFDELILPVTHADREAINYTVWTRTLNGKEVEVCKNTYTKQYLNGELNRDVWNLCTQDQVICIIQGQLMACSDNQDSYIAYEYSNNGLHKYDNKRGQRGFNPLDQYTGPSVVTGNRMYYGHAESYDWTDNGGNPWSLERTEIKNSGYDATTTCDIALHGSGEPHGGQPIPVQWYRSGDGELLETEFYIEIGPGYGEHGE